MRDRWRSSRTDRNNVFWCLVVSVAITGMLVLLTPVVIFEVVCESIVIKRRKST